MRGMTLCAGFFALACGAISSQPPSTGDLNAKFEVAALKRSPAARGTSWAVRGGPGTSDPDHVIFEGVPLIALITQAFDLRRIQVVGPAWLETEVYYLAANIPSGATKTQFKIMLQNLLKERLEMRIHHETKGFDVYDLSVAKGGLKVREAAAGDPEDLRGDQFAKGIPTPPNGRRSVIGSMTISQGEVINRIAGRMQDISGIADTLERLTDRPVLDKTQLEGEYDYDLSFTVDSAQLPSNLPSAVERQLGLKMDSKRDTGHTCHRFNQQGPFGQLRI
jgi:uncharacterized protein (TIGR03435 family)